MIFFRQTNDLIFRPLIYENLYTDSPKESLQLYPLVLVNIIINFSYIFQRDYTRWIKSFCIGPYKSVKERDLEASVSSFRPGESESRFSEVGIFELMSIAEREGIDPFFIIYIPQSKEGVYII